jgi:hypothetical protein
MRNAKQFTILVMIRLLIVNLSEFIPMVVFQYSMERRKSRSIIINKC